MSRTFQTLLSARFSALMAVGLAAVSVLSFLTIRETLDREIDATLMNIASIQAASLTREASGEMHLQEWELTPVEAASILDLNRYVQVWTEGGRSLLRTRYITHDLPLDRDALKRSATGAIVWTAQTFQGVPIRSLYYPLGRMGDLHAPHVLQVAAPLASRNRMLIRMGLLLFGITMLTTAGVFMGSWWLAHRAVRPVHEITKQAAAISPGNFDHRISAYAGTREYQGLVQVLNMMLSRLQNAFDAQTRFTADASHELRSPLTALRGELEVSLRRDRAPGEYRRVIASALEEVERLSRTAEDLLTLARSDAGAINPRLSRVDLHAVATRTAARLGALADARGIRISVSGWGDTMALADHDLVGRLAWNLMENAIKFTPSGGEVSARVAQDNGRIVFEVDDNGPGIPSDHLERVFDRFHRVDTPRTPTRDGGAGLGLSIVKAIADAHGAAISVANLPAGGARFRVSFSHKA
jgi:two-component system OmpR family sensor kinase